MQRVLGLGLTLLLAGCAVGADRGTDPPSDTDGCGAARLSHLVGQQEVAVDRLDLKGPVRVIEFGSAVTLDHRPDRINVALDRAGRIQRIYCG